MDKTDSEENALQALYRHPMWIEYDTNTTKGKIEVISRKLGTITPVENSCGEKLCLI